MSNGRETTTCTGTCDGACAVKSVTSSLFMRVMLYKPSHGLIFEKGSPNWILGLETFETHDFLAQNNCIN